MAFSDYWYRKQRATPALNDEAAKLTITVASLKKEIEKAYQAGVLAGMSKMAEIAPQKNPLADLMGPFGNPFG